MSDAQAAIKIENLSKFFGREPAVSGLSLEIPTGSVFGLLGENGAGKTTTIQMLLGMIQPDAGKITVLGRNPAKEGLVVRRRVGYVPEVPALYDWMTVNDMGWFVAGFHPEAELGTAPYLSRYSQLIQGFELPSARKIRALSKGMRAKVSLALAMASDPDLLILDEPTSGLDALVRREFLESMVDLAGAGRTVLLSSHQIGEVERVASHVALVHKGKLLLAEPLDELRGRTFLITVAFTTRDHPTAPPDSLPITLIDATDAPRQARWLVHAADRAACERLRALPGVESLEIDRPTLEDIYIGYMRSRKPAHSRSTPAIHVA